MPINKQVMAAEVWNFGTWAVFKTKLKATFEDQERSKNACTVLHQLKQGTQTADAIFLQFDLLSRAVGISDDRELVAFLKGGAINKKILTQMYYSNDELPEGYEAWKKKIIKIDGMHRRAKMIEAAGPQLGTTTSRTSDRPVTLTRVPVVKKL
jgi:hypothetical protein